MIKRKELESETEYTRLLDAYVEAVFSDILDGQDILGNIPKIQNNLEHIPEAFVNELMGEFTSSCTAVTIIKVEGRLKNKCEAPTKSLSEGPTGGYLRAHMIAAVGDLCSLTFTRKKGDLVAIINLSEEKKPEAQLDLVCQALEQMTVQVEEDADLILRIAVSEARNGFPFIHENYCQAEKLMQYADLFSERSAVFSMKDFFEIRHHVIGDVAPDEILRRFMSLLVAQEYDHACELMLMMVTNYAMIDLQHTSFIRSYTDFLFELADAITKQEENPVAPRWKKERVPHETMDELQEKIIEYFSAFSVHDDQTQKTANMEQLIQYMEEHFADNNLDVSALARIFSMNLSHMSRVFKQKAGVSPQEYLQRLRINAAKELLVNSNLTMTAIAGKVGYLSAWTLTRAFRRQEGITPGQYRSLFMKQLAPLGL